MVNTCRLVSVTIVYPELQYDWQTRFDESQVAREKRSKNYYVSAQNRFAETPSGGGRLVFDERETLSTHKTHRKLQHRRILSNHIWFYLRSL